MHEVLLLVIKLLCNNRPRPPLSIPHEFAVSRPFRQDNGSSLEYHHLFFIGLRGDLLNWNHRWAYHIVVNRTWHCHSNNVPKLNIIVGP